MSLSISPNFNTYSVLNRTNFKARQEENNDQYDSFGHENEEDSKNEWHNEKKNSIFSKIASMAVIGATVCQIGALCNLHKKYKDLNGPTPIERSYHENYTNDEDMMNNAIDNLKQTQQSLQEFTQILDSITAKVE